MACTASLSSISFCLCGQRLRRLRPFVAGGGGGDGVGVFSFLFMFSLWAGGMLELQTFAKALGCLSAAELDMVGVAFSSEAGKRRC